MSMPTPAPVKDEALRVAVRHDWPLHYVSNSWMRLPDHPLVHRVVVAEGPDAADDWIAAHAGKGDIVVTADIPLAHRCVKAGARAIRPDGKILDEGSIGMALAMRNLMQDLREAGGIETRNPTFGRADRSRFLQAMETLAQAAKRG